MSTCCLIHEMQTGIIKQTSILTLAKLSQALRSADAKPQAVAHGQVDNSFRIDGLSKRADLRLTNDQGFSVDQVVVENSYVQMTRPLAGSDTGADNQCREFPINEYAQGISHHGQASLVP